MLFVCFQAASGLDNTVRIFALESEAELRQIALMGVPNGAHAGSVCLWQVEAKVKRMTLYIILISIVVFNKLVTTQASGFIF